MNSVSTPYRIGLLALALLMVIFNVGLPIMLASCPMMGTNPGRASCCAGASPIGSLSLRSAVNSFCCKTTLAAERNTNEFLQVTTVTGFNPQPAAIVLVEQEFPRFTLCSMFERSPFPPDQGGDLPVFLSTLII